MNVIEKNTHLYKKYAPICLFALNFLAILLVFGPMLREHYSPDTYSTLIDADQHLWHAQNGRFVFGLFYALSVKLGISAAVCRSMYTFVYMAVCAYCAARLVWSLEKYARQKGTAFFLLCSAAVLVCFVNVFMYEWYVFGECMMMYAIAVLCAVEGGLVWLRRDRHWLWNAVLSFVWFFLSVNSYQAILSWYVVIAMVAVLLPEGFQLNKRTFLPCVAVLGIGGVNSLLNQKIVKLLAAMEMIQQPGRSAVFDPWKMFMNFLNVWGNQKAIWVEAYDLLPKGMLLLVSLLGLLLVFLAVKKRSGWFAALVALAVFLGSVSLVFIPQLVISSDVWLAHRTLTGIFAVLGMVLCGAVVLGNHWQRACAGVLAISMLVMSVPMLYKLQGDIFHTNEQDQMETQAVVEWMKAYEAGSGNTVNRLVMLRDESAMFCHPGVYYRYDLGIRIHAIDWSSVAAIDYAMERPFQFGYGTEEQRQAIVQGRNWDEFNADEQLIFEGDTMYFILY